MKLSCFAVSSLCFPAVKSYLTPLGEVQVHVAKAETAMNAMRTRIAKDDFIMSLVLLKKCHKCDAVKILEIEGQEQGGGGSKS